MRQAAFTILTRVEEGQADPLTALLEEIGDDIAGNPHLRWARFPDLHYASLFLFDDGAGPVLVFEGNIDGPVEPFLRQLVAQAGSALDLIFGRCVGYPAGGTTARGEAVAGYLRAHDIGAHTFHVAWRGRTVAEIGREEALRESIGELIDAERDAWAELSAQEWRIRIQDHVRRDPSMGWALSAPKAPWTVRHGRRVVAGAAGAAALSVGAVVRSAIGRSSPGPARGVARLGLGGLALAAAGAAKSLRDHETEDDRRDLARRPPWDEAYAEWAAELPQITGREDVKLQNHLASVTAVKPGAFRAATLRTVLWVVNVAAALVANRGELAGISTIHFARWVVTPDGRSLLFMSNFDGSWESYLNDFIELAAPGLTAVWTNSDNQVGFPHTRWLIKDGARQEARFKAYARASQVRSLVWYSAHPDLSVANVGNNLAIRRDLFAPLDAQATRDWLRRL